MRKGWGAGGGSLTDEGGGGWMRESPLGGVVAEAGVRHPQQPSSPPAPVISRSEANPIPHRDQLRVMEFESTVPAA